MCLKFPRFLGQFIAVYHWPRRDILEGLNLYQYQCRNLTSLTDRIFILLQFFPPTSRWISETRSWNSLGKGELRLAVVWSLIDIASTLKLLSRFKHACKLANFHLDEQDSSIKHNEAA